MSQQDPKFFQRFSGAAFDQLDDHGTIECEDCGRVKQRPHPDKSETKFVDKLFEEGWGTIAIKGTSHVYLVCHDCLRRNLQYISRKREEMNHVRK